MTGRKKAVAVMMMIILLFQCGQPPVEGRRDFEDAYRSRLAVEAVDQTPRLRFGDELLTEWFREIVLASGSYIILPREQVRYLMQGTLKQVNGMIIFDEPAINVQFELWITELDPETKEPALMPIINITRSVEKLVFTLSPEEAIKEAMVESFEDVKGGIPHEHKETEKNIDTLPGRFRIDIYPYHACCSGRVSGICTN